MSTPRREQTSADRGSAMIMAVFTLVLLATLGTSILFLTHTELRMSQASSRIKSVFYLAEAGIEDGRRTLFDANGEGSFDDDLEVAAGDNADIDIDPLKLRAVYGADGEVIGFSGAGDDVPVRDTTVLGEGHYAVYLSNDPVDGRTNTVDSNNRVLLTGIGAGPGRSLEIVEAIIKPDNLLPDLPLAAITLLGQGPNFESGTSNKSRYSGVDCDGAGEPGLYVPTVGTIGFMAELFAENGIAQPNGPEFESDPALPTAEDTVADLTDTSEPLVDEPIGSAWLDCPSMVEMVEDLRGKATNFCAGNGCSLPAGLDFGDITFIDNGMDPSFEFSVGSGDPDGKGILVVTGKLHFHGTKTWRGLILVIGRGDIERSGAGNGVISGALVVGDVAGLDDRYGTADDCGVPPTGFDLASYRVDGGGNGDTTYCSKDLEAVNLLKTYEIVDFLQH